MKKIVIGSLIIVLSLNLLSLRTLSDSKSAVSIDTKLYSGSDLRYCLANDAHSTNEYINECEILHHFWNECISGSQSMHCTTQHIMWISNTCTGNSDGPWDIDAHEVITCN